MNTQEKVGLLKNNKSVAMLAPTFVIDFKYPNIIGMLRRLGFKEVTELTYGARMVNWAYAEYVKKHPDQELFISSPCPTVVATIKTQYPEYVKFLMPIVSPMAAMARIYKKKHPDYKVFFISPCWAKENIEAPRYKGLIDGVIPLKELKEIFESQGIKEDDFTENYYFDSLVDKDTRVYPISGGLASTSHIGELFKEGEVLITDGFVNIKKAFDEIKAGTSHYRFLDLLNCPGGCIGGPAINNKDLPTETKKEIIIKYTQRPFEVTEGEHKDNIDYAKDVDFSADLEKYG
jgi:iron only hydrogenase large subunit-like protein